jgi:hypothetical protein
LGEDIWVRFHRRQGGNSPEWQIGIIFAKLQL